MEEANKEQAEVCAQRALKAYASKDMETALRWFDKSLRLYASDKVKAQRDRVAAMMQEENNGDEDDETGDSSPARSPASAPASGGGQRPRGPSPSRSAGGAAGAGRQHSNPTPASSHHAKSSSHQPRAGTASSAPPAQPQRPYTAEMVAVVDQIKKARDYYSVLGVERNADEEAIKRAYRKLAVKIHPDKNAAPGAEEAFKRVGSAFAVLSDPSRRDAYDRDGQEEGASPAASGGGGGGGGMRHRGGGGGFHAYHGPDAGDIDPEMIFRMFFGGGMPPGFGGGGGVETVYSDGRNTYRVRRGGPSRQQYQQQQQQQGGDDDPSAVLGQRLLQLMQLLPIIILVLLSLFSFGGSGADERWYSLAHEPPFTHLRYTQSPGVVSGLPYYVKQDFMRSLNEHRGNIMRVERAVQQESERTMREKCERDTRTRLAEEQKARFASGGRSRPSSLGPIPSCEAFEKHFGNR